ncbi:MAG TPA: RecT family recombinase [Bacillota bacterium]
MSVPQAQAQNQSQPNALALVKRDTVDVVAARIRQFVQDGELALPANYSPENAMKSAWLILQSTVDKERRPVLKACTKESIANALLDMVIQGLNPAKRQCYFIPYGDQLVCQRSYFGDEALVLRVKPDANIWYGVVYEGDEFEYQMERGLRKITKHVQQITNIKPDKIIAAYCVIEGKDGQVIHTEVMTIDQIHKSWQQSKTYRANGDGPHNNFPDQMCLRTAIRRASKAIINSSSDDYLLLERVNRSDEVGAEAEIEAEVEANANGEIIDAETKPAPAEPQVAAAKEQAPAVQSPAPQAPTKAPPAQQAKQTRLGEPGF